MNVFFFGNTELSFGYKAREIIPYAATGVLYRKKVFIDLVS